MRTRSSRGIWIILVAIFVIAFIYGMSGCAAFTAPQSLDQRIAAAYTTHTAVLDATATSLAMGDITSDQAQNILDIARRTRTILDGARIALGGGDIQTAEGQLQLALAVLAELQSHLRRAN